MINWTNTHFRVLMRIIAPKALLYTEMQTYGAIINNPKRALIFNEVEKPLALQLGGSNKKELVECAKIAVNEGYSEINLNVGCPSSKVQAGKFGACLMLQPELVADCILALKNAVSVPISVKTRIGVDNHDSYELFSNFVHILMAARCDKLIVHARKAWLKGLSPKKNRTVPPINYEYVYKIKREFKNLPVIINGDISQLSAIHQHMQQVDGIMIGRLACENPYAIAKLHQYFFPNVKILERQEVLASYINHIALQMSKSVPLSLLLKPILNMSHGLASVKTWKAILHQAQQSKSIKLLDAHALN